MHFPTVALIGKPNDPGIAEPLLQLARMLEAAGRNVLFEADTAINTGVSAYPIASIDDIGTRASLAIVMGGDGTMLGAARQLALYNVPMVGINHGRLGFITDIPLHNALEAVTSILDGQYEAEERVLLEGRVIRDGRVMFSGLALNDVVLSRAGRGGMIEARVELDNVFMYSQRADGLIIATPTGSTAYSLAVNGPIMHPRIRALLLVPVAPQTLSHRPIVLPDTGTVGLTITALGRVESGASVHFDMQTWSDCQPGDRIEVRRAAHSVRFIHPTGYSFFSTLRHKLHWNHMPQPYDNPE